MHRSVGRMASAFCSPYYRSDLVLFEVIVWSGRTPSNLTMILTRRPDSDAPAARQHRVIRMRKLPFENIYESG